MTLGDMGADVIKVEPPYAYIPTIVNISPLLPNVVSNLNDSGIGSLRHAMEYADTNAGLDTITFDVSGVIELLSPLPPINGVDGLEIIRLGDPVIVDGSAVVSGDGFVIESSNNMIWDLEIRGFPGSGIVVKGASALYNNIGYNVIYGNGGLGIDLGDDGVTENDSLDTDTGPNDLINFPEIDSVFMKPDSTFTVYGRVPESEMIVTFYVAHPANDSERPEDPSGHGEAYSRIGTTVSDLSGQFVYTVPNTASQFSILTATATRWMTGPTTTSEFCENFTLIPSPLVIYGYSPINIMVTDPHGNRFGKDGDENFVDEISPADYFEEIDIDSVVIYEPIQGTYTIEVYGTIDAEPGTVYSMGVRIDGSTQVVIVNEDQVPLYGMPPDELEYEVEEDGHYVNGDADGSGSVDIDDVVYLINYIFSSGPPPDPPDAGDADCSYDLDIDDVVYLINYIFSAGPEPCAIGDE